MIGNGRGQLDYGICFAGGSANKVTVYLNEVEISTVVDVASQVIEFDYTNGDRLKIQESGNSVFQFNGFSVIGCK